MPQGCHLIDTQPCSIVEPYTPVPFVALSCIWGTSDAGSRDIKLEKTKISLLERPGSFAEIKLPRIIMHAISLCRDSGEQFVWVDRICIVQDDGDSKSAQIEAMGSICHYASFTIVAALNARTADIGLPGHAEQARRPWASAWRPSLDFSSDCYSVTPNGLSAIVDSSMWNRQGWNFQERLLSKRLLFITEYQVIFECSSVVAEEEFTWDWDFPTTSSTHRIWSAACRVGVGIALFHHMQVRMRAKNRGSFGCQAR